MRKKTTDFKRPIWFEEDEKGTLARAESDKFRSLPQYWDEARGSGSPWLLIPEFKFDLVRFSAFIRGLDERHSITAPSKKGEIKGWALTSKMGSGTYGIDYIKKGRSTPRKTELVHPTVNCTGYAKEAILKLGLSGFSVSRARILALGPGAEMAFHRDDDEGNGSIYPLWRLHIPVITNPKAKFEWMISGRLIEKHVPADGHCYMINVSEPHRAVNRSASQTRYHFVCSLIWRNGPNFQNSSNRKV